MTGPRAWDAKWFLPWIFDIFVLPVYRRLKKLCRVIDFNLARKISVPAGSGRVLLFLFGLTALGACSHIPLSSKSDVESDLQGLALAEMSAKAEQLKDIADELRAENEKLRQVITAFEARQRQNLAEADRNVEDGAIAAESMQAEDEPKIALKVPVEPKTPEAVIVAGAEALDTVEVPVESTPRLVEPSFVAVDAVFENEAADVNLETTSLLFGVHLASYRNPEDAALRWREFQEKYPDQLGLLEPRVQSITIAGRGEYHRLIVGGFASRSKADALCENLRMAKLYCEVMPFSGLSLSATIAG